MPRSETANSGRRLRIRVAGRVQGVGFRPYVFDLARRYDLAGSVNNDEEGVLIEVEGSGAPLFVDALGGSPPPLARIDSISVCETPALGDREFVIAESRTNGAVMTSVVPDAAICSSCITELFDPGDRRHLYPFINCMHCGPRYTITRRLPYDRAQTSMAPFKMCAQCDTEYRDPADRRFHAQPQACPACGPRLSMPVDEISRRINAGEIIAVKGLGGFHLACDARCDDAVSRLRQLKQRDAKPFAIMVLNVASAAKLAEVGAGERTALEGRDRPIVILKRHTVHDGLAAEIAPGLGEVGIMLPYTPLHYLLFHALLGEPEGTGWLSQPCDPVLVMTSANPKGEPLAIDANTIAARFDDVVDAIVDHDREIVIRADDGVMRMIGDAPAILRRARGRTPDSILLPHDVPSVLAVGGHLKTTICLTRGNEAVLSQHIGDLDNRETARFSEGTIDHLKHVLQVEPVAIAHDRHPDFLSTRFAHNSGLPTVAVQHHHAHVAAVAAEHHVKDPVIGLALDGYGYGDDGGAWGGELLMLSGSNYCHLGQLAPLAQPGGDRASREPWRMAAAALWTLGRGEEIPHRFPNQPLARALKDILSKGINTPLTSSCGRLFDAACGLLGIRETVSYEGEAPMSIESLVRTPCVMADGWFLGDGNLDMLPLLDALTECEPDDGADLFHGTLIAALVAWGGQACDAHDRDEIVLGGGCIANRVLTEGLISGFADRGIRALIPRQAPPNDGGLSLGQAWIAGLSINNEMADLGG